MTHESPGHETTFGYLSTIQSPEHGYFGGYLLISALGRPLEFHCTAPVRPSRAQEILYGPTLQPYLLGEQIGLTLLGAAKLAPHVVLTDQAATLSVRARMSVPLVMVLPSDELADEPAALIDKPSDSNLASSGDAGAASERTESRCGRFTAGSYGLQLPSGYESDHDRVLELLTLLAERVDLAEPFDRIHEAIREAQRIGERTPEAHGQAA